MSRKPAKDAQRCACNVCGRLLRPLATGDFGGPSLPAHKCPHGKRCTRFVINCEACAAVCEARPTTLEPVCVWCSTDVAAGAGGKGCRRCGYSRGLPADRELLAELRAGTGDVWATR